MPIAVGESYATVQLGLCLGGIIRIFEDEGSSLWSAGADSTIVGLQCGGYLGRTAQGEHHLREMASFHRGTGTLMMRPRFPLRSEHTAAGLRQNWATYPIQLAPPERPRANWLEDFRALLARAIQYVVESGMQLRVETGGWDSPKSPFCSVELSALPNGSPAYRFEASPEPVESRWWTQNLSRVDETTVRITRSIAEFTLEHAVSIVQDFVAQYIDPWSLAFTYADPRISLDKTTIGAEPDPKQAEGYASTWRTSESQHPDILAKRRSLEDAATDGDRVAMTALGALLTEDWDPPDLRSARIYLQRAAAAGDTEAMYRLGALLVDRWDPPDHATARIWYERAAVIGGPDAMFWLGGQFAGRWDPPDLTSARVWWGRAAIAGHTGAMCDLGLLLATSDPPDFSMARRLWEIAAAGGQAAAMVHLGNYFARSSPPDLAAAEDWWVQAADAGDSDAMFNLAIMFANSDPRAATAWIQRAAAAGHSEAMAFLEKRKR